MAWSLVVTVELLSGYFVVAPFFEVITLLVSSRLQILRDVLEGMCIVITA